VFGNQIFVHPEPSRKDETEKLVGNYKGMVFQFCREQTVLSTFTKLLCGKPVEQHYFFTRIDPRWLGQPVFFFPQSLVKRSPTAPVPASAVDVGDNPGGFAPRTSEIPRSERQ
jgi:hypothetical protein